MSEGFFVFGTLMDRDVAAVVLGRRFDPANALPAWLHGYQRLLVAGECYPALAPRAGGKVTGLLLSGLGDADLARMQFFESEEFEPRACEVELADGRWVSAQVFLATEALQLGEGAWRFDAWLRDHKAAYLERTRAWMAGFGRQATADLEVGWSEALPDVAREAGAPGEGDKG